MRKPSQFPLRRVDKRNVTWLQPTGLQPQLFTIMKGKDDILRTASSENRSRKNALYTTPMATWKRPLLHGLWMCGEEHPHELQQNVHCFACLLGNGFKEVPADCRTSRTGTASQGK